MQIIINIFISFVLYLLIAYSFWLMYSVAKFFNLAHASYITISAYLTYWLAVQLELSYTTAILFAVIITIVIGLLLEKYFWQPIKKRKIDSMSLMIISLGVYIVFQNCISLIS